MKRLHQQITTSAVMQVTLLSIPRLKISHQIQNQEVKAHTLGL